MCWVKQEVGRWFKIRDNGQTYMKLLHSELTYKLHQIEYDTRSKVNRFKNKIYHKQRK